MKKQNPDNLEKIQKKILIFSKKKNPNIFKNIRIIMHWNALVF